MTIDVIEENRRAAILRLTIAERECLKRCLNHQTAKQMALDLRISPHAVEKRLKMARAKLGLSSSLEAAKLVESLERSGRLVPGASDLPRGSSKPDEGGAIAVPRNETSWITRRHLVYLVSGAILMSVLAGLTQEHVAAPSVADIAAAWRRRWLNKRAARDETLAAIRRLGPTSVRATLHADADGQFPLPIDTV